MTFICPTIDEDEAELFGRLAALRGESAAVNPYNEGAKTLWLTWDLGWRDEHRRIADERWLRKFERRERAGAQSSKGPKRSDGARSA